MKKRFFIVVLSLLCALSATFAVGCDETPSTTTPPPPSGGADAEWTQDVPLHKGNG